MDIIESVDRFVLAALSQKFNGVGITNFLYAPIDQVRRVAESKFGEHWMPLISAWREGFPYNEYNNFASYTNPWPVDQNITGTYPDFTGDEMTAAKLTGSFFKMDYQIDCFTKNKAQFNNLFFKYWDWYHKPNLPINYRDINKEEVEKTVRVDMEGFEDNSDVVRVFDQGKYWRGTLKVTLHVPFLFLDINRYEIIAKFVPNIEYYLYSINA